MKKTVLGVLAFALMFSFACGGGSDEAQIKALVDTAASAMKAGEFDKLQGLTVEGANVEGMPTAEMLDSMPEAAKKQMMDALKGMTVEVTDIKVDGDTATGHMKMTFMGQTNEQEGKFRKVNGKWLIDE